MAGWLTTQWRRRSRWTFIAPTTRAVRWPSAFRNCFFPAIFGLRCSGQAWRKGSLALAQLCRQLCARSMRNTLPAFVQPLRLRPSQARSGGRRRLLSRAGGLTGTLNRIHMIAQLFRVLPGRHNDYPDPSSNSGVLNSDNNARRLGERFGTTARRS